MSADAYNAGITNSEYDPSTADASANYELGDGLGGFLYRVSGTKAQNDYNSIEAERARIENAKQAKLQRDWEQRMADTTYQRTVADMKAAGINPAMLSGISPGSATSTGSGSSASTSAASSGSGSSLGIIGALASVIAAIVLKRPKAASNAVKYFDLSSIK